MTKPMCFEGTPYANGTEEGIARAERMAAEQRRVSVRNKIELVDLVVYMNEKVETDSAILVYDGTSDMIEVMGLKAETIKKFWLPKSLIEYDRTGTKAVEGVVEINLTLPAWLAIEKGLV